VHACQDGFQRALFDAAYRSSARALQNLCLWIGVYERSGNAATSALKGGMRDDLWNKAAGQQEANTTSPTDALGRVLAKIGRTSVKLLEFSEHIGLLSSATPDALAHLALRAANDDSIDPGAFRELLWSPGADAAFPVQMPMCGTDQHHTFICSADEEKGGHRVRCVRALLWDALANSAKWTHFVDPRLPFAMRAMDQEWERYRFPRKRCGCGCACRARRCVDRHDDCSAWNPLFLAISEGNDKAGAWLAKHLPPNRLQQNFANRTPLGFALQQHTVPKLTVKALLARLPDFELAEDDDGSWFTGPLKGDEQLIRKFVKLKRRFRQGYHDAAGVQLHEATACIRGFVVPLLELVCGYAQFKLPEDTRAPKRARVAN
jgi:hypothetical protein